MLPLPPSRPSTADPDDPPPKALSLNSIKASSRSLRGSEKGSTDSVRSSKGSLSLIAPRSEKIEEHHLEHEEEEVVRAGPDIMMNERMSDNVPGELEPKKDESLEDSRADAAEMVQPTEPEAVTTEPSSIPPPTLPLTYSTSNLIANAPQALVKPSPSSQPIDQPPVPLDSIYPLSDPAIAAILAGSTEDFEMSTEEIESLVKDVLSRYGLDEEGNGESEVERARKVKLPDSVKSSKECVVEKETTKVDVEKKAENVAVDVEKIEGAGEKEQGQGLAIQGHHVELGSKDALGTISDEQAISTAQNIATAASIRGLDQETKAELVSNTEPASFALNDSTIEPTQTPNTPPLSNDTYSKRPESPSGPLPQPTNFEVDGTKIILAPRPINKSSSELSEQLVLPEPVEARPISLDDVRGLSNLEMEAEERKELVESEIAAPQQPPERPLGSTHSLHLPTLERIATFPPDLIETSISYVDPSSEPEPQLNDQEAEQTPSTVQTLLAASDPVLVPAPVELPEIQAVSPLDLFLNSGDDEVVQASVGNLVQVETAPPKISLGSLQIYHEPEPLSQSASQEDLEDFEFDYRPSFEPTNPEPEPISSAGDLDTDYPLEPDLGSYPEQDLGAAPIRMRLMQRRMEVQRAKMGSYEDEIEYKREEDEREREEDREREMMERRVARKPATPKSVAFFVSFDDDEGEEELKRETTPPRLESRAGKRAPTIAPRPAVPLEPFQSSDSEEDQLPRQRDGRISRVGFNKSPVAPPPKPETRQRRPSRPRMLPPKTKPRTEQQPQPPKPIPLATFDTSEIPSVLSLVTALALPPMCLPPPPHMHTSDPMSGVPGLRAKEERDRMRRLRKVCEGRKRELGRLAREVEGLKERKVECEQSLARTTSNLLSLVPRIIALHPTHLAPGLSPTELLAVFEPPSLPSTSQLKTLTAQYRTSKHLYDELLLETLPELERAIVAAQEKLESMESENAEWEKADQWISVRESEIEEAERRSKEYERRKSVVAAQVKRDAERLLEKAREAEEAKRGKASFRIEISRANEEAEEARRRALERIRARNHDDEHGTNNKWTPSTQLKIASNLRALRLAAADAVTKSQPPLPDLYEQDMQRRLGGTLDSEGGGAYGTWRA